MKSPMNMAPNKMKSPMKKPSDLKVGNRENLPADLKAKISAAPMKEPMKMKSPMQMSPAKMGSAYKMDKSAFKLKSAPVNMNTPGSVAKLAGVSPMKTKGISVEKKKQGFSDYKKDPVTGQASASRPATKEEIERLKNKK